MKIFNNNGINQLINLVKSNDKELRTLINGKAASNHTHNEMFKNRGLNTLNIDTEYKFNYCVGISAAGHGTYPAAGGWFNIVNFACDHFATQLAWTCTQSTNPDRIAYLYFREKYYNTDSQWTTWRELSVTRHNHDSSYIKKSGDTMSGALNFANNTWNSVGDDVAIGDSNVSGTLCVKGLNADGNIRLYRQDGTKIGDAVVSEDFGNFGCRIQVGESKSMVSKSPSFGFRRLSDNNTINFFAEYPKSMAYGYTNITFGSYMNSSDIRDINIPFSFGIDSNGNYGYKKLGADTVIPFSKVLKDETGYTWEEILGGCVKNDILYFIPDKACGNANLAGLYGGTTSSTSPHLKNLTGNINSISSNSEVKRLIDIIIKHGMIKSGNVSLVLKYTIADDNFFPAMMHSGASVTATMDIISKKILHGLLINVTKKNIRFI